MSAQRIRVDEAIVGGIAGLWLLNLLRGRATARCCSNAVHSATAGRSARGDPAASMR